METLAGERFGGAADLEARRCWLAARWRRFAAHRLRLTDLLCGLAGASRRGLAVLGAGACTDLDLSRLAPAFGRISLVDGDGEALDHAPLLQPRADWGCIEMHGGVDLTGLYETFARWRAHPPDAAAVAEAASLASAHRLPGLDGGFGVVVSACVLSQLAGQAASAMGRRHPRLTAMIAWMRRRHLEQMLDLAAPGGCVAVVTDVVSSRTAPITAGSTAEELRRVLDGAIRAGNFFTGCNPYAIGASCRAEPGLRARIGSIALTRPWTWQVEPDRVQLVCALLLEKAGAPHPAGEGPPAAAEPERARR